MTTFTIDVEFYVDGAWLSVARVSEDLRVLVPITIRWGRTKLGERVTSTNLTFTMIDNLCWLEEDNYASPYYRKITIDTEVRVTVDGDLRCDLKLTRLTRVPGETPDKSFVQIEAAGLLHGMDIAQQPLKSAAYDAFSAPENDAYRVFYVPLEEESGATSIEVYQGRGLAFAGQPVDFGADTDSLSSARLLTFGDGGSLSFDIPVYSSTEHRVSMLWKFPNSGLTDGTVPLTLRTTGGNIDSIRLLYSTPNVMRLQAMQGVAVLDSAVVVDWTGYIDNGQEFFLTIELTQNGADIDCLVGIIREDGVFGVPTDTLNGATMGRIFHVDVTPTPGNGCSFGQFTIGSDTTAFNNYIRHTSNTANGVNGYRSERANARLFRVLTAADIVYGNSQGTLDAAVALGTLEANTLGDVVYEAVDSDGGIIKEWRNFLALVYNMRFSLYNKPPTKRLEWRHLTPPVIPNNDDTDLYNDFTVRRVGGSSARHVVPDDDWFHRTTQPSPLGIGPRPGGGDVSLENDDTVLQHAAWRAHERSWREKRFDAITVDLGREVFTSTTRAAARSLKPADTLWIDTELAPAYVPYNEIRLMIQGGEEEITKHNHRITFHTTPNDIFEVQAVDADGSILVAGMADDATAAIISPPTKGPTWTEELSDLPYRIQINGDAMEVTAISENTPAFVAAGTAASANNASVAPGIPAGMAAGGLMLLWASIRTGTVNVPAGWATVEGCDFGNTHLMWRYWVSGDSAPTVTFSGGVANADTWARIFGFSGLSHQVSSNTKAAPTAHTLLNSSAQNIAYPALTITRDNSAAFIFAQKSDDWTGVAPPSGFTEMWDAAFTAGDDSGAWAGYDLTGVSAAAGSLVVTGGASAISRAIVLSLRPTQTATVTRGIAGTPAAHSVGAAVHMWRPGVNAL